MRFDPATDPDERLYRDLVDGDGELAARELMRRVKMFLCKKCPEFSRDADEIALDIFERVCERVDTFRWESRFFTWVCSIAYNALRERLRDKDKEPLPADFLEEFQAQFDDPEKIVLAEVTREVNLLLVEEFLGTLPERQRQVFFLKHSADGKITSEQIGEKLGISAGAVRSAFADANAALERWRKLKGY